MAKKATVKKKSSGVKKAKSSTTPKASASAKPTGESKPGRYLGATSGLRVKDYQNKTLAENFKTKLTDEQLAANWHEEFPKAVKFTTDHVRSVRNAWNRGAHGNDAPDTKLPAFDENGEALPIRGEKKDAETGESKGKVLTLKKKKSAAA